MNFERTIDEPPLDTLLEDGEITKVEERTAKRVKQMESKGWTHPPTRLCPSLESLRRR